jgi:hypothetical protein
MLSTVSLLLLLLIAFAILGIYDIFGNKRISINVILLFVIGFILIFLYQVNFSITSYISNTPSWYLAATILSAAILLALPKIGFGDKLFLVVTFFVYPFWLIWIIIVLAELLIMPLFKLIFYFKKEGSASLPFYPFLFLAVLVIYLIITHFGIIVKL